MTLPAQRPGLSRQDYETPPDFIAAVRSRFGTIAWDLAASAASCRADSPRSHYGPGSSAGEDALVQDWTNLLGTLWLNPPFGDLEPWARKCAESAAAVRRSTDRVWRSDWRIAMLTPASIGANWFARHVHRRSLVLGLSPRLTFAGEKTPYPKDLMLSVFGVAPGFDVWRWS